jgi:predicted nucleic acid-binding protein
MGFLRLLTSLKAMGKDMLTPGQAWDFLDGLRDEQKIIFADEPSDLELEWRGITHGRHSLAAGSWTDTYLAAFAVTAGYTLVTFDRGLARRTSVQVRCLTPRRPT